VNRNQFADSARRRRSGIRRRFDRRDIAAHNRRDKPAPIFS
jgi:hypothetical protein